MTTDKPDSGEPAVGISTMDLMEMSLPIRRIVRVMLRKPRLTYEELCEAIDKLPEEKRPSREDLDAALKELTELEWLIRSEEGKTVTYQVRMKKKEGSDVSRSSRARGAPSTMKKLWDTVESDKAVAKGGEKAQREMSKLHQEIAPDEPEKKEAEGLEQKAPLESKKKPERRRRRNPLDALKFGDKDKD